MKNTTKTREQLLKELENSNKRIAELEKSEIDRKKTEEALLFTQFAIDHYSDAAFWMEHDARFIYVNEAACNALGYSREELLTMTVHDVDPDFPEEVWADHWAELKNRGSFLIESHHRTRDGKVFPVELKVNYLEFGGNEYNCAFARNISERKQAEEEMQKLSAAVKHSSELVNLSNLDGRMTFLNESGGKMLGIEPHEVENVNIMEVIPDHLIELVEKELLPTLLKGGTWEGNLQYRNMKTGELTDVHAITFTVKDTNTGEPQFLANVSMDITESKRAEEALLESEEKYRTIFESSPEAIVLFDKKGNVVDINGRIEDWLGYKPGDIIGKNLTVFPFMSNKDKMLALKRISLTMGGEEIPPFELEFIDKIGEKRIGLITASSIKDNKGEAIQNLVMISDITERKKVEEELAKHREHLEELVEKRTDELKKSQNSLTLILEDVNKINQDLRNANTMLDATNKELEAFSYSVSHDLRAPLTRMDGFSKALLTNYSGKLDDQGVHYLNRIRASSQHMAKLIDNLLSLSRITRGIVTRQKVDLTKTTIKIAEELKKSESGREVEFKIVKGLRTYADRKFVEILLENLLGNSFKFTGKKENAVIEFGEKIIGDNEIFFIKDNGIGFNMKYYNKIFIAFQRLHSEEEYKGTGIGLAIAQRIINRHGGKIWAESEEGKGATFYFKFE